MKRTAGLFAGAFGATALLLFCTLPVPAQVSQDDAKVAAANITTTAASQPKYRYLLQMAGEKYFSGDWNSSNGRELYKYGRELVEASTKRDNSKSLLLVQKDSVVYQIEDVAVVAAVSDALAPVRELGRKMGVVGESMGEIGIRQGAAGKEQGVVGKQIGEVGKQMGLVAVEQARLSLELAELSNDEAGNGQRTAIATRKTALDGQFAELNKKMAALGQEMGKMRVSPADSDKQRDLSQKMRVLGQEMKVANNAARIKIEATLDKAFAEGKAKPVAEP